MSGFQCSSRIPQIEYAIQKSPEYANVYTINVTSTTAVPPSTSDRGSSTQQCVTGATFIPSPDGINGTCTACDVDFTYSSGETGYTQKDRRRVTFRPDPDSSDDYLVNEVSNYNPNKLSQIAQPEKDVLEYYRGLKTYNKNWISYGWKKPGAIYNPPRPNWDDVLFEKNIEIYNSNFNATRNYINSQTDRSVIQDLFKRRIAPVPADPIPPNESDVTVPYTTASTPIDILLMKEQEAADNNNNSISNAQTTYTTLLPSSSPNYDPPVLGDSYETVLIKFNKAFDLVSATQSASINATTSWEGSDPSTSNRRLIGRLGRTFPVPGPIIPPSGLRENAKHFAPYKFTERQKYLIDYTPVNQADKMLLKANFCKSLGYLPANSTKTECADGDCCAPLPDPLRYTGSLREGFDTASASSATKKCIPTPAGIGSRNVTISIASPPLNIETSNRLYTYRMSKPIADCKPKSTETNTIDSKYDAIRSTFIQEIKKSLDGDKMFSLRCPGSCFTK